MPIKNGISVLRNEWNCSPWAENWKTDRFANGKSESWNGHGFAGAGCVYSKVFLKEKTLYGITHIGARSTVDDSQEISFETHFEFIIRNIRTQNESTVVFQNPDSTKIRRIILSYRADQKRLFDRTEILGNKTACFRFFIDIRKHQVKLCNHKIILSAKEFDVLYLSYSNLDVAFMIKQIYEVV